MPANWVGNNLIMWDREVKTQVRHQILYPTQLPPGSYPLSWVTSEWPDGEVKHVETIDQGGYGFALQSGNVARNYLAHWVGLSGNSTPTPGTGLAFYTQVGNTLIQWGLKIKDQVDLRTSFPTRFGSTPAVLVTSDWREGEVGYVDTIYNVTSDGFNVHSGNRDHYYYVHWIAIGFAPGVPTLAAEMEEALTKFQGLARDEESLTKGSHDQSSGQANESAEGKP